MAKFKVGDMVRLTEQSLKAFTDANGETRKVIKVEATTAPFSLVTVDETLRKLPLGLRFHETYLELVVPPLVFEL